MKSVITILLFVQIFSAKSQELNLPHKSAGWTDQEAAAHLLNRLAYGPLPGQVGQVASNPSEWVEQQIKAATIDGFEKRINETYTADHLSLEEIGQTYPAPGVRLLFIGMQLGGAMQGTSQGRRYGMHSRNMGDSSRAMGNQNDLYQRIVNAERPEGKYARFSKFTEYRFGWKDFTDLFYQLMARKLDRAIHSPNQLEEIMVDFWLNHFNVSIHGVNDQASMVYSYERDAIRPHALGKFRDLLGATAKHPAMLLYLDNHRSNADEGRQTLTEADLHLYERQQEAIKKNPSLKQFAQQPGVNENYARELLELHTLGVDGGYTQKDVEEVARAFTGWKASPMIYPLTSELRSGLKQRIKQTPEAILEKGFFFDPSQHDAEPKVILGDTIPAGGGVEEGERILNVLAVHPNTARFISLKLAQRFVSDAPPASLVDKMAASFLASDGDIRRVVVTMIVSEEFWDKEHLAGKIKTPLEVIASAVRATNADISDYRELIRWCTRMGQPLYAYQAPTGYPEEASFWTNGAALVNRMNFANELATGELEDVSVELLVLNDNHEPESKAEALELYLGYLLPGRNSAETYDLLLPVLAKPSKEGMSVLDPTASGLEKVVGLILGSPEFQRQ